MSLPFTSDDNALTTDAPSISADASGLGIPSISASEFAARLLRLYPRGWLGDAAQRPGGVAYAAFLGLGTPLAAFSAQLLFIKVGTRIRTAVGSALDTISVDYFGPGTLPRAPRELDPAYRARILQNLLVQRVTRAAIKAAIERSTGVTPRMGEPWSPGDCGCYDVASYFGMDGPQGVTPARYGDALPYTGFVDIASPVNVTSGGFPIYGIDIGAAIDVSAVDLTGSNSAAVSSSFVDAVGALIGRFKAFGVTVGIRSSAVGSVASTVHGVLAPTVGATAMAMSDPATALILRSWMQAFGAWLEVLPWLASSYIARRGIAFEFEASAQAPPGASPVGWLVGLLSVASAQALRVPVNAGQSSLTCAVPVPAATIAILTADWDTIPYVTALDGSLSVGLSAAGPGNLDIAFIGGTAASVPEGSTSLTVSAALPASYSLFATPSWASTMSAAKSAGSFTVEFGTAAPAEAVLYWSALAN